MGKGLAVDCRSLFKGTKPALDTRYSRKSTNMSVKIDNISTAIRNEYLQNTTEESRFKSSSVRFFYGSQLRTSMFNSLNSAYKNLSFQKLFQ